MRSQGEKEWLNPLVSFLLKREVLKRGRRSFLSSPGFKWLSCPSSLFYLPPWCVYLFSCFHCCLWNFLFEGLRFFFFFLSSIYKGSIKVKWTTESNREGETTWDISLFTCLSENRRVFEHFFQMCVPGTLVVSSSLFLFHLWAISLSFNVLSVYFFVGLPYAIEFSASMLHLLFLSPRTSSFPASNDDDRIALLVVKKKVTS